MTLLDHMWNSETRAIERHRVNSRVYELAAKLPPGASIYYNPADKSPVLEKLIELSNREHCRVWAFFRDERVPIGSMLILVQLETEDGQ